MDVDYIIVQAGGKGTRLGHLTKNKPKAIVPIDNKPILFHLFDKFPKKTFIIIGDYLCNVLQKYTETFAKVKHIVIKADGCGTCGGISKAMQYVPKDTPFLLMWSDLILEDTLSIDNLSLDNHIGISKTFECRWSYKDGLFEERASFDDGVAGFFIFKNKDEIADVPNAGEFVRWLKNKEIHFNELAFSNTRETGTLDAVNLKSQKRCRPFNSLEFCGNKIIKKPITDYGKLIHKDEIGWYKKVQEFNYEGIPKIYSYDPLTMDRIDGENLYQLNELSKNEKKKLLGKYIETLQNLHGLEKSDVDLLSINDAYYLKTIRRLDSVRNLIPFANEPQIRINNVVCKNIYHDYYEFRQLVEKYLFKTEFAFIHGDCTFSNSLADKNGNIKLIDPRGYFGYSKFYGDVNYDWAKVYYSVCGNYDQFNNKQFNLSINQNNVELNISSSGWEELETYFFEKTMCNVLQIKLIHAIIWLSLTTYAWEDYDSICGAFYNGLLYYNEVLQIIERESK